METQCRLCFEEMERIFPDNEDGDDIDCESQLPADDDDLAIQICKQCIAKLDEFDETFGSEVKPEDSLKISSGFEEEQQINPKEVVSSSSFHCSDCREDWSCPMELNKHLEHCPAKLTPEAFDVSITNVTSGAHLRCDICNRSFDCMQELKDHESVHYNSPMKCIFCLQTFICGQKYKFHVEQHEMKGDHFTCDLCGLTFKKYIRFEAHKRSHSARRSQTGLYKCQQCPKRFASEGRLLAHKKTHSYSLTCKICGGAFSTYSHMKTHMEVMHTQGHSYKCKQCDRNFTCADRLRVHMKTHANLLSCKICGGIFYTNSHMNTHMKVVH